MLVNCYDTVQELYAAVYSKILREGDVVSPRGMLTYEIIGASGRVQNPRARLIRRPGKAMSLPFAIGEFLWYLRRSNKLDIMSYYSKSMVHYSDDKRTLNSAYGARIWGCHDFISVNQWQAAKRLLLSDKSSRQAVLHIRVPQDEVFYSLDHPCTLTLQFLLRNNRLHLLVTMRSNDLFMGSCYDIFSFTMLQEMMAWELDVEIGFYQHSVNSWHLYERDICDAQLLYTGNSEVMPEFSFDDKSIDSILATEENIRLNRNFDENKRPCGSWKAWGDVLYAYANKQPIPFEKIDDCYKFITR